LAEFKVAGKSLERLTKCFRGGASLPEEVGAGQKIFTLLRRLKPLRLE
jgi:hypothetical protein